MNWPKYRPIIRRLYTAIWLVALLCVLRPALLGFWRHPSWLFPFGIILATCIGLAIIVCFVMDAIRMVVRDIREARPERPGFEVVTSSAVNDDSSTRIQIGELGEPLQVAPISTPLTGQKS